MKIKCPLCDFENGEGSKFCKNCNEPLFKQGYSEDNPYIKKRGNKDQPFKLISDEEIKAETEEGKYNMNIKPVDVIFLERADGHKVGDEFPNYFEYQYGANPSSLLEKALTNNFLIKSDSIVNNMEKTKTSKLKEVLKKHNLKVSGKKQEQIERLIINVSEEELKTAFPDSYYILNDKGKSIVQENEHIIYYHKSQHLRNEISLDKYHDLLKDKTDDSVKYDIALELLKNKAMQNRDNGDWGLYRNSLFSKAKVYEDKQDNQSALELYLAICHIDLSGLSNGNAYMPSTIFLAPGIISLVRELTSKLELDKETLKEKYFYYVEELKLPKTRFSKEQSLEYLIRATEENIDKMNEELREKTKEDEIEILADVENNKPHTGIHKQRF